MQQTYPYRNWPLYNQAMTREKFIVFKLISDAVNFMQIPYCYKGNGRPHLDNADMLKACVYKVFCNSSSRRSIPELQIAKALGYLNNVPAFNMMTLYMRRNYMTPYFEQLYKVLAMPMISVENNFAADSTGFSTFAKKRWFDVRLDQVAKREYVKLHIMSGVATKIITSAIVTKGHANDAPFFEQLTKETAEKFKMRQVAADAGYLSKRNCAVAEEVGAMPFILPKSNTKMFRIGHGRDAMAWRNMIRLFRSNDPYFMEQYHKRSNVESAFSMMKRKFMPFIRAKNFVGQKNELLAKVACHNASILCNAIFALNLDIDFEGNSN